MKDFSLFLLFLFVTNLSAQPFWSKNFNDGFPNGWQTEDLNRQNVEWKYAENNNLPGDYEFKSKTSRNGFLAAFGSMGNDFKGVLTTDFIDCSDKSKVYLEFENFIVTNFVSASIGAKVYIKNEDSDWFSYVPMPKQIKDSDGLQKSYNSHKVFWDISNVAAGHSKVQIRWEWRGYLEEFWAIDDIALFDYKPYYDKVVWGQYSRQGDFNGGKNGWTETVLEAPDPTTDRWVWKQFGSVENALAADKSEDLKHHPYLNSFSGENGAMVFNADFYSTNGTNPSAPLSYYHTELISPVIDLENVEKEVNLRFEQLVMKGGGRTAGFPSMTSFALSTDGGRSWGAPTGINTRIPDNRPIMNTVQIPLCGVAGKSEVRLKFIFAGHIYFWVIDDVVIVEKPDNDMRINTDFYSIAPNVMTPVSQVENIGFTAGVENVGQNIGEDVEMFVEVSEEETGLLVFKDSLLYGNLDVCSAKDSAFENFFLPPEVAMSYRVKQYLKSEDPDDVLQNDTIQWNFEITDSTYAKETGGTISIKPADGNDFEYGNVFYVPKGDKKYASSVTFGVGNTKDLGGEKVTIYLYRAYADEDDNQAFSEDELHIVGIGEYVFTGIEGARAAHITVPLIDVDSLNLNKPPVLENNVYYLATVSYDGIQPCRMLASQKYDYFPTWALYDSLGSPRFASAELLSNRQFDLVSLDFNLIPVIRLNINENPTSSKTLISAPAFSIFPNPTTDFFVLENKSFDLKSLFLYDTKGVLVKKWEYRHGDRYDISTLPKGAYFLKLKTELGAFVRQVIKNE